MKKTLIAFICFSQIALCSLFANEYIWPKSETNTYEMVHDPWKKVLIPLPDFKYVGEIKGENSTFYEHILYSHRRLLFTLDIFPNKKKLDLKKYSNWFTQTWQKEGSSIMLINQEEIISGSNNSTKMLFKTFKNNQGTIHQLYFANDNHGYCFTGFCYPPKEMEKSIVEEENKYWQWLMHELAKAVDFYE